MTPSPEVRCIFIRDRYKARRQLARRLWRLAWPWLAIGLVALGWWGDRHFREDRFRAALAALPCRAAVVLVPPVFQIPAAECSRICRARERMAKVAMP